MKKGKFTVKEAWFSYDRKQARITLSSSDMKTERFGDLKIVESRPRVFEGVYTHSDAALITDKDTTCYPHAVIISSKKPLTEKEWQEDCVVNIYEEISDRYENNT